MSLRRTSWDTVSKALVKSTATRTVRSTGFSLFNPVLICDRMSWRAVVVDLFFAKTVLVISKTDGFKNFGEEEGFKSLGQGGEK